MFQYITEMRASDQENESVFIENTLLKKYVNLY